MKNFFKNKNIFITGISGFVGSNLAKSLVNDGANVFGLIKSKKISSLLFYEKIDEKCSLFFGDVTEKEKIKNILRKNKIEICFHLAAQVEVGQASKYPYETWESNVRGTYTLLEAIRENKKKMKSVIVASTDKAYGEYGIRFMPYKEHYNLKPIYPYDTSKACADLIAKSYTSELYNIPIIITRFANIFGEGQLNFSALIPDLIRSCILKKKFIIRGNGNSIRDFIYIKDIVEIYKLLATKLYKNPRKYSGEVFNAGTNKKYKVREIIKIIFKYSNKEKEYQKIIKQSKKKTTGELDVQFMDYKKLNKFFGWKPKYKLKNTLPGLFKWYEFFLKKS